MGVCITAYRKCEPANDGERCKDGREVFIADDDGFPEHLCGMVDGERYSGIPGNECYESSYGSYSGIRRELKRLAKLSGVSGSFSELLKFSDCDGTICTAYCKKLYGDFVSHEKIARENLDSFDMQRYMDLKGVFMDASDDGCVEFG